RDRLTTHDYLWRWDTDWFWCSRAFGAQNPKVRRLWPKHLLRSSFYWKLVALDRRWDIGDRLSARKGEPPGERVVQDIEVHIDETV
ncbi:FAD-binding protein, partial [Mycobacterium kansasii]